MVSYSQRGADMLRDVACIAVIVVMSAGSVFGQGAVAELNGIASDQSGSVLPGVMVTLTEETTGIVRTVVSNETGRFVLPAITPGRYTIRAELAGFQSQTRSGITIAVGQAVTINFTLPVGTQQAEITVSGEAPLIEVTQTQIGTNVLPQDFENLPMQGREQFALMQLVPGLTPALRPGSFEGAAYNANGRDNGKQSFFGRWSVQQGRSHHDIPAVARDCRLNGRIPGVDT